MNPELGPTGLLVRVPSLDDDGGGGPGSVESSNSESLELVSRLDRLSWKVVVPQQLLDAAAGDSHRDLSMNIGIGA